MPNSAKASLFVAISVLTVCVFLGKGNVWMTIPYG